MDEKNPAGVYKINEFSKISGIPAPNLRFYEMKGYPRPQRSASGYRQYKLEDAYRINTFNMLTAQGFSVTEAIERLDYHDGDEYCAALEENNKRLQMQLWLLETTIAWNKKMQYVYSHIKYELSISRTVTMPEMVFLKCSDGSDLQESYKNSKSISQWVKLLPATLYAERWINPRQSELGMVLEKSIALQYGLVEEHMAVFPPGKYFCMLTGDDNGFSREETPVGDRRIPDHLKSALCAERDFDVFPVLHIYLMVGEKHYGEFLNYMLLKTE